MATIAHFIVPLLVGLALKLDKLSIAAMVFFAMLPDIDVILGFVFMGSPFALHRGFTHSLVFACVPLAGYIVSRRKELFFGFLGALSHPLIDLVDKGGIPLLWPFSSQYFELGLWKSTNIHEVSIQGFLRPDAFISDKLALALLTIALAYYAVSWWLNGFIRSRRGRANKERRD